MFDKLQPIAEKYEAIEVRLSQPDAASDPITYTALIKEYNALQPVVDAYRAYCILKMTLDEAEQLLDTEDDPEMRAFAMEESEAIKQRIVEDGVKYIVNEPNMTEDMKELYDQLVEELGLKTVELSNLSSLSVTQKSSNMDYLTIMYENLAQLEVMASANSNLDDYLDDEVLYEEN
jgi:hypothetical protein